MCRVHCDSCGTRPRRASCGRLRGRQGWPGQIGTVVHIELPCVIPDPLQGSQLAWVQIPSHHLAAGNLACLSFLTVKCASSRCKNEVRRDVSASPSLLQLVLLRNKPPRIDLFVMSLSFTFFSEFFPKKFLFCFVFSS